MPVGTGSGKSVARVRTVGHSGPEGGPESGAGHAAADLSLPAGPSINTGDGDEGGHGDNKDLLRRLAAIAQQRKVDEESRSRREKDRARHEAMQQKKAEGKLAQAAWVGEGVSPCGAMMRTAALRLWQLLLLYTPGGIREAQEVAKRRSVRSIRSVAAATRAASVEAAVAAADESGVVSEADATLQALRAWWAQSTSVSAEVIAWFVRGHEMASPRRRGSVAAGRRRIARVSTSRPGLAPSDGGNVTSASFRGWPGEARTGTDRRAGPPRPTAPPRRRPRRPAPPTAPRGGKASASAVGDDSPDSPAGKGPTRQPSAPLSPVQRLTRLAERRQARRKSWDFEEDDDIVTSDDLVAGLTLARRVPAQDGEVSVALATVRELHPAGTGAGFVSGAPAVSGRFRSARNADERRRLIGRSMTLPPGAAIVNKSDGTRPRGRWAGAGGGSSSDDEAMDGRGGGRGGADLGGASADDRYAEALREVNEERRQRGTGAVELLPWLFGGADSQAPGAGATAVVDDVELQAALRKRRPSRIDGLRGRRQSRTKATLAEAAAKVTSSLRATAAASSDEQAGAGRAISGGAGRAPLARRRGDMVSRFQFELSQGWKRSARERAKLVGRAGPYDDEAKARDEARRDIAEAGQTLFGTATRTTSPERFRAELSGRHPSEGGSEDDAGSPGGAAMPRVAGPDLVGVVGVGEDIIGQASSSDRYEEEIRRCLPDNGLVEAYMADWKSSKARWRQRESALTAARRTRADLESRRRGREVDAAGALRASEAMPVLDAQAAELAAARGPDAERKGGSVAWLELRLAEAAGKRRQVGRTGQSSGSLASVSSAVGGLGLSPRGPGLEIDGRRVTKERLLAELAVEARTGMALAGGAVSKALEMYPDLRAQVDPAWVLSQGVRKGAARDALRGAKARRAGRTFPTTPGEPQAGASAAAAPAPAAPGPGGGAVPEADEHGIRDEDGPQPALDVVDGAGGTSHAQPDGVGPDDPALSAVAAAGRLRPQLSAPPPESAPSLSSRLMTAKAALRQALQSVDDASSVATEATAAISGGHWGHVATMDPLEEELRAAELVLREARRAERLGRDMPVPSQWRGHALPPGLTPEQLSSARPLTDKVAAGAPAQAGKRRSGGLKRASAMLRHGGQLALEERTVGVAAPVVGRMLSGSSVHRSSPRSLAGAGVRFE